MDILIADDHNLFLDSLAILIHANQPDINIDCANDYFEVKKMIQKNKDKYHVVILDLNMPGMQGAQTATDFCQNFPNIPLIIMSGMTNKSEIESALKLGAKGFIPKSMPGKSFVNAISIVADGDKFIHPSVFENKSDLGKLELSPRENQTLKELFLGKSNKDISKELHIKEATVKLHIKTLFKKFDAKNRADLIIKSMKKGFYNKI